MLGIILQTFILVSVGALIMWTLKADKRSNSEIDPIKNKMTPLMILAGNGEVQPVLELLATGADVNETDNRGKTALMYAAMNKQVSIVKILLDVGANPNLKTNKGSSAADFAIRSKSNEIVQCLNEYINKKH